jgi:hypothetical protein
MLIEDWVIQNKRKKEENRFIWIMKEVYWYSSHPFNIFEAYSCYTIAIHMLQLIKWRSMSFMVNGKGIWCQIDWKIRTLVFFQQKSDIFSLFASLDEVDWPIIGSNCLCCCVGALLLVVLWDSEHIYIHHLIFILFFHFYPNSLFFFSPKFRGCQPIRFKLYLMKLE